MALTHTSPKNDGDMAVSSWPSRGFFGASQGPDQGWPQHQAKFGEKWSKFLKMSPKPFFCSLPPGQPLGKFWGQNSQGMQRYSLDKIQFTCKNGHFWTFGGPYLRILRSRVKIDQKKSKILKMSPGPFFCSL